MKESWRLRHSVLVFVVAIATSISSNAVKAELKTSSQPQIGIKGYCIVCVVEAKRWVKGTTDYPVTYDGMTYLFPGTESRNLFVANPQKYAPVLNGDSVVSFAKSGKRVAGSVRYATLHKKRVYMFSNSDERREFRANIKKFENADVAFSGNCPVCMAGEKKVPGRAEFSLNHCGVRYLFPGEKERIVFLRDPEKYAIGERARDASAKATSASTVTERTTLKVANPAYVTIVGKTGCAACEHGVSPIGAPNELGLAVIAAGGKIFVVEDAHQLYPALYKDRFDGHSVKLVGKIVRQTEKATWIKPESLDRMKSVVSNL